MKFCSNCQLEYDDKFSFCQKCGGKLDVKEEKKICSSCGKDILIDDDFCPFCGATLKDKLQTNKTITSVIGKSPKGDEGKYRNSTSIHLSESKNKNITKGIPKTMVLAAFVILLVLGGILISGNVGHWISANKAMYQNVSSTLELGNLRRELGDHGSTLSLDEFNKKVQEYNQLYAERKIYRNEYINYHKILYTNNSIFKDYDALPASFSTRFEALLAEEEVLDNNGTWFHAKKAYEEKMNNN